MYPVSIYSTFPRIICKCTLCTYPGILCTSPTQGSSILHLPRDPLYCTYQGILCTALTQGSSVLHLPRDPLYCTYSGILCSAPTQGSSVLHLPRDLCTALTQGSSVLHSPACLVVLPKMERIVDRLPPLIYADLNKWP